MYSSVLYPETVDSPEKRLQWIRRYRDFDTATEAARAYGWNENTYRSHENGTRPFGKASGNRYAKAFRVPVGWLMFNEGDPGIPMTAPLVGYVGAGSEACFFNDDISQVEHVELPRGGSPRTVAVQVRGTSMAGIADAGWLVYYEDVRTPPTEDLFNTLCVVGLADGRTLIKRLMKGRKDGFYDLWSTNEPPIQDQQVAWAAKVTWIKPQ